MNHFKKILFIVSAALFIGGVALGLLGRAFCTRGNDMYMETQPESFVPDTIETVLHDSDLKQIYVCYKDANCVNVYTESGAFLWCVATPYMRNPYFELQGDKLIIYNGDAYIYNSESGDFLGLENDENLDLSYDWEDEYTEEYISGHFYFDNFQVYRALADGTLKAVVTRPWWHHIFNFALCLVVAFIGATGIGIAIFLEKEREYKAVKKTVVFKNRKAKIIRNYFKITTVAQVVYAFLNLVLAFFTDRLIVGIIPLAIHFIISNMVLWNMVDRLSCEIDEIGVVGFWRTAETGSFIIAFISVIIASVIAG